MTRSASLRFFGVTISGGWLPLLLFWLLLRCWSIRIRAEKMFNQLKGTEP